MALPTLAQWADEMSQLTVNPSLGTVYLNAAPIFRAFGLPIPVARGKLKINWTDGATAGSVATSAGATHSGAPAQVNDAFTKDFAAIASQAYTDIGMQMGGAGFETNLSIQRAVSAIHDNWVAQIISTNDGDDYEMWGAASAVASADTAIGSTTMAVSGSYSHAEYDSDKSLVLDAVEEATLLLPKGDGSHNVCICSDNFYKNVSREIRKVGGNTSDLVANADFGFNTLKFQGVLFFNSHNVPDANSASTFYMYNVGANGCQLVVPLGEDMFEVQGPKYTVGALNEVWDIALKTQLIYTSPRSVVMSTQICE